MKRHRVYLLLLLLVLPAILRGEESKLLFNGKDLSGWTPIVRGHQFGEDPNGVFTVRNGMIRVSGEEYGGIISDEEYSNFHLSLEFKWGEQTFGQRESCARDSGFLFHSTGEPGAFGGVWSCSYEANIIEGGVGDFWLVGDETDGYSAASQVRQVGKHRIFDPENGEQVKITLHSCGPFRWRGFDPDWKDEKGFCGKNDIAQPGEWTKLEVIAAGDTAEFYVNGELVNRVTGLTTISGKFQLQSEGAEIFYRNITLEPAETSCE